VYSAWLARFVERDKLDAFQCRAHWAAAEPLLRLAVSGFDQSASGTASPFPTHARASERIVRRRGMEAGTRLWKL
jgi:hypothetical protein